MSESEKSRNDRASTPPTSYTCPGELYSIPRGIHLARLAAFYHKCRECEHRIDIGQALPVLEDRPQAAAPRPNRRTLVCDESIRGVYLNELDRTRAIAWGEAFASLLWDQRPPVARGNAIDHAQIVTELSDKPPKVLCGPTVVVGFDERTSSPDIVTGAVLGLRRMGCPVTDLGQTGLPTLLFNLHVLNAAAGFYVTGAGCDSSVTGFEFLAPRGMPFRQESLLRVEELVKSGVGRQTRQIGGHYPRHGQASYEGSLESRFHALRPLRIVCGSSSRLLQRTLDRLFVKLPCVLVHEALPMRRRNLYDARDVDLQRVATAVTEGQHDLGVIIDGDGQHLAFVTDRGRLVSPREIGRLLIEVVLREDHAAQFVVSTSWYRDVSRWLEGRDAVAVDGGESAANLVQQLMEREAALALSSDGRVWYREEYAACDALLVLASALQALSFSDTPFSEVIARISSDLQKDL
jgi:phosphomannomutase